MCTASPTHLDDDGGRYQDNDAFTVGAKYQFGELSSIGAEVTTGDRGDAALVNGEYRITPDHTLYASYAISTDDSAFDPLFNARQPDGLTLASAGGCPTRSTCSTKASS